MNEVITKKCSGICGEIKEVNKNNFRKRKISKDGFVGQCKICQNKGVPSHIIEENGIKYQVCTGECKLKKELNNNNFDIRNDCGKFNRKCKTCLTKRLKIYFQDNREKLLADNKQYIKEHKIEVKQRRTKHYKENRNEILEKHRQKYAEDEGLRKRKAEQDRIYNSKPEVKKRKRRQQKQKRRENIQEKIRHNVSGSILNAIRKNGGKKKGSILNKLPYSIEKLKQHIESLFEPWMNWNNWGKYNSKTWIDEDKSTWTWQLDHFIPHALFKYISMDDQIFKDCWALSNLRPYNSKLNQHDGATKIRHKLFKKEIK